MKLSERDKRCLPWLGGFFVFWGVVFVLVGLW